MTKIFEAIEKANKKRIKPPSGFQSESVRFSGNGGQAFRNRPDTNQPRNPWAEPRDDFYQNPSSGHGNPTWGPTYPEGNGRIHPANGNQGHRPAQGGYYGPPPSNQPPYYYDRGDAGQGPPPGSGRPPNQQDGGGFPPPGGGSNQGGGGPGQPASGAQTAANAGQGYVASPVSRAVVGDLKLVRPLTILFQNISALLPDQPSRSIMIMESRPNEGAPTLALEFAKVCAVKLNKRVRLMDADQSRYDLMARYGASPELGWGEAVYHNVPLSQAVTRLGDSQLHYTQVASRQGLPPIAFDSLQITDVMDELKKEFDLILIQPPAGLVSADGLLMARRVDGVILVVEAEKTRYQVVERVRDQLETNNARILGVILNKRRFPIPKFIYKYL